MTSKRIIKPTHYPWDPNFENRPYSLAVERHGLLCISGLTAETYSPQRGSYIVESTSLVKQTEVIFGKMGVILEAAGYTYADVVYTVDYALEAVMPEYRASGAVRRAAFGDSMPAAVGILVNGIPNSVSLMAVSAVAMRGGRHKRAVFPEGTPTWERYRSRTFWPGFFVGDDWFWLSGSTGRRFDPATGREAYRNGIEAQAIDIWDSALGQVIHDAGVDPDRIVKVFDYVHPAGVEGYHAASRNRGGLSSGGAAQTGMVISRLLHRPALLETDALCYMGNDKQILHVPGWQRDEHSPPAAVRCGKYLFCSGLGPIDPTTGAIVGRGDFDAQLAQTYANLRQVLEAAGASPADVVRTLEFVNPQNAHRYNDLDAARRNFYSESLPAATTVTANQLLPSEAHFGLEAWAVLE